MSVFNLAIFLNNVQFTLIYGQKLPGFYQYYSLLCWTLLSLADTSRADPLHGSQLCRGKGKLNEVLTHTKQGHPRQMDHREEF